MKNKFVFEDVDFFCWSDACLNDEFFYNQQKDMKRYVEGDWFGTIGELKRPLNNRKSLRIKVIFEHINGKSQIDVDVRTCRKGYPWESEGKKIGKYVFNGDKADTLSYKELKNKIEEIVRPYVRKVNKKIRVNI